MSATPRIFFLLCLAAAAQSARASCSGDLFSASIANLPDQTTSLGCESDNPDSPKQCEWETTVEHDTRLGADRRLVLLFSNHLGGSGSRQVLTVYSCVSDHPVVVLRRRYINGAHVEPVNGNDFAVVSGVWAKGDPMCCPSRELREVFSWDPVERRYV